LLLARERGRGWSFLPGGHVEPGEPVTAALVREIAEELGVHATVLGFAGVVEYGYVAGGVPHHELNLVFDVDIADATPVGQEAHLDFHWLAEDELATADVRPAPLKDALLARSTPFWRGWSG
jgi:8-oxo-dGTP pyrophosphatase MutT (NUDIX family)